MKTAAYRERRTFLKYDDKHYLLYLNEQRGTFTDPNPDAEAAFEGYSYCGDMDDGATCIQAADVTDADRRDKFIAGLIATRYSIDAQIATLANGSQDAARAAEFAAFARFREECKAQVDELLAR